MGALTNKIVVTIVVSSSLLLTVVHTWFFRFLLHPRVHIPSNYVARGCVILMLII